jgi:hypothetical protein
MTNISGGLKTAFYIISVVLSAGLLVFIMATYKYEKELTETDGKDDAETTDFAEPVIEDCDGQFDGNDAYSDGQNDGNDVQSDMKSEENDAHSDTKHEESDDQNDGNDAYADIKSKENVD